MRIFFRIFLFLIIVLLFSCEEQGLIVKCRDCTEVEPLKTSLKINLDTGNSGAPALVEVWEGYLEDGVLYSSTTATGPQITVSVTLNKMYTVTATYYRKNSNYIAVDSATPKIKYEKDLCEIPCYFVYDRVINLKLKSIY